MVALDCAEVISDSCRVHRQERKHKGQEYHGELEKEPVGKARKTLGKNYNVRLYFSRCLLPRPEI